MSFLQNLFGQPDVEKLKAKSDIEGLIKAVVYGHKKDWKIQNAAREALYAIGAPTVEPLIAALKDNDRILRLLAANTLQKTGDSRAVEPLIAALNDSDDSVRYAAIEALGEIGDAAAVESLISELRDSNRHMRMKAAAALGKIGDARAAEPLAALLKDNDTDVRYCTDTALVKIGAASVGPLLAALGDNDSEVREFAANALAKIGTAAIEPLLASLKDENTNLRISAAGALGRTGDPQVIDPLIEALRDKDRNVRKEVTHALHALKTSTRVERVWYPRYSGTESTEGKKQCDVCGIAITPGNAYLVPKEVFYASKKYKDSLAHGTDVAEMIQMLGGNVDHYLTTTMEKDKRSHTAVCNGCIHLFEG